MADEHWFYWQNARVAPGGRPSKPVKEGYKPSPGPNGAWRPYGWCDPVPGHKKLANGAVLWARCLILLEKKK